jgi:hypothetical protein
LGAVVDVSVDACQTIVDACQTNVDACQTNVGACQTNVDGFRGQRTIVANKKFTTVL